MEAIRMRGIRLKTRDHKYLEIFIPNELVFDDYDLLSLLYDSSPSQPFQHVRNIASQLMGAIENNDALSTMNLAWEIIKEPCIPTDVYRQIAPFLIHLPVLHKKLPANDVPCNWLELHKGLWNLGMIFDDDYIRSAIGHDLSLCYERMISAPDFRKINHILLEIARRRYRGQREEAVRQSNIGFSFMMECNWKLAIAHFEKAASMMRDVNMLEYDNIRLNLLISRFGERGWAYDEDLWNAAVSLGDHMREYGDWRERKSLVCRARVQENTGNLEEALELIRKAVKIGETMNDMYLEQDLRYLHKLEDSMLHHE